MSEKKSISAAIFLAPGFEEIEAITCIDILRRSSVRVTSIGTISNPVVASRQTIHLPDCTIDSVRGESTTSWDLLILPGGAEGVANLKLDVRVRSLVEQHWKQGKWIAAICAAPTILHEWGILEGESFIAHPGVQKNLPTKGLRSGERVVVSQRLITSLAAGSSIEFSYEIIRQLLGEEAVRAVDQGVCSGLF